MGNDITCRTQIYKQLHIHYFIPHVIFMIYTYVCVPHFLPSLQWNVQVAAGKAGMDAYLRHEFFGSRISFCWITPQMTGRCWVQILLRVICYTSGPDPLLPSDTKMIQWKSLAWSHRDWVPFYLRLASEIFQVLRVIFLRSKRKNIHEPS